ncbi:hypothetical protein A9Q84_13070 [Halobacteriovorax marinus]|uniref:HTH cro/C1-type domain-containing protein n=1 Tax=Halobacteriovorax marinus TaxID=97084 RepID=A0A1Y5FCR4_9BACT|nr:hypothetical protein A9Q84_13070 [Halobacteriovorax marinus]
MKIDEQRLAKLIFASRKRKGYTQSFISKETGITQGTLSKIESGQCSVSAKHWFLLSKLLDIPSESVWSGLIDRGVKPTRENEKNTFKLPKHYFNHAHSSVKEIIPILEFVSKEKGAEQVRSYLNTIGIVDFFFFDLNNKINFSFATDLLKHFYPDQLGDELYRRIGGFAKVDEHHGVHAEDYKKKNTGINLLKSYIENSHFYQNAYKYKIVEKESHFIKFTMEASDISKNHSNEIEDILIPFKKAYLESFSKMDNESSLKISVEKSDELITFLATLNHSTLES